LQNYNRYGYCFNNPMTCSDPSGLGFASLLKWLDPLGYAAHKAMTHSAVGRAFIQWEIYVGSSWCGPWAAACYGAGEAINASLSGYSDSQAFRIGLVSGATAYANDYVGSNYSGFENVAAHAVVGCASAAASGGSCRSGAVGAAVGSAYDNATGLHYTGEGAGVVNFVVSSSVGGLASLASGGTFADGAKQAAYSYLFNFLGHVHRYLSMHGAATANLGLTYGEIEQFGEMVRGVDALPGSQDPEMSRMHGMCMAGESPGDCGRITARYIDNLWEEKSVDALAKLVHLDQDSYAPKHAGGQPYSGFGLSNLGEAVAHGWSDRMPDSSVSDMLIRRTQTLIRDYNEYCGGCVKSGLKKGP
jgi:hypothetical protein